MCNLVHLTLWLHGNRMPKISQCAILSYNKCDARNTLMHRMSKSNIRRSVLKLNFNYNFLKATTNACRKGLSICSGHDYLTFGKRQDKLNRNIHVAFETVSIICLFGILSMYITYVDVECAMFICLIKSLLSAINWNIFGHFATQKLFAWNVGRILFWKKKGN